MCLHLPVDVRRVAVTGNAGSGKTTLSRLIGDVLELPVVHLDQFVWLTGWRKRPAVEKDQLIDAAADAERWVIDGVSQRVRELADVIVFLDLPLRTTVRRSVVRALRLRYNSREELGEGFPELRALPSVIKISFKFGRRIRPQIISSVAAAPNSVHIRSKSDLNAFVGELVFNRRA